MTRTSLILSSRELKFYATFWSIKAAHCPLMVGEASSFSGNLKPKYIAARLRLCNWYRHHWSRSLVPTKFVGQTSKHFSRNHANLIICIICRSVWTFKDSFYFPTRMKQTHGQFHHHICLRSTPLTSVIFLSTF